MLKKQSNYLKKQKSKIWDDTFGRVNPLLKGKYELISGEWKNSKHLYPNTKSLRLGDM